MLYLKSNKKQCRKLASLDVSLISHGISCNIKIKLRLWSNVYYYFCHLFNVKIYQKLRMAYEFSI
ncbi:hypothetical protein VAZ01S_013_00360 [Vibrio azureus NBRC 104587]|uniref:Uncharacterized protein n=1 Tax=Vibrio azureus NBRC 104587 TaxID=1219077 RepID=U3BZB0_9VIBR|nr:hypothetical protein VAZ01S_013_00360 [Vibrio azureus NBRC 104587]